MATIKRKRGGYLIALMIGCSYPQPAQAQIIDYSGYQKLFGQPITSGATGVPQRASDAPLNMVILTQEDIKRSAAKMIPDVLRQVPGVNVRQVSPNHYDVSIRGYNQAFAERLLVLIDGRQVYQDFYGLVSWNTLPVTMDEIQQIEVIKGPNTALYGFNATSGVINIITKNPAFENYSAIQTSAGTQEFGQGSVNYTHQFAQGGVRLTAGAQGFESPSVNGEEGKLSTNPEPSGAFNAFGKLSGQLEVAENTLLGFEYSDLKGGVNQLIAPSYAIFPEADFRTWAGRINLTHETENWGIWNALYYRNDSSMDETFSTVFPIATTASVQFNNVNDVYQLANNFNIGPNHVFRILGEHRYSAGYGYEPATSDLGPEIHLASYTASGLWEWSINEHASLSNAVRYDTVNMERVDNNPAFDRSFNAMSINSGLVFKTANQNTFRLTYARAVDLPSFVELGTHPESEISITNNYAFDYEHHFWDSGIVLNTSVFYQKIKDMQTSDTFGTGASNPLDSRAHGGEISLSGGVDNWRWGLGYSRVDTADTETGAKGSPLEFENNQSENIVNANIGYEGDGWTADLYGNYMSEWEPYGTTGTIEDVYRLDLKLNYDVTENFSIGFTGMTISGDEYEGAGFEIDDSAFITLNYTF